MTEFEYEKACRGPLTPVSYENAWGTAAFSTSYTIVNRFKTTEYSSTAPLGLTNIQGNILYRVGIEATSSSDRVHAGATYYGILNMTGSVFERCLGGFNSDFSAFTNINGNGNISSTAGADVNGWPSPSSTNYIERGGSAGNEGYRQQSVSSRFRNNLGDDYSHVFGGRGVRSY
ncbi:MAG: hypothetical protein NT153_02780 [Bacteroidetes bacterium]|nr:hypothetical protein [Bacteroidota bacterium]